jgi:hypothetical protein
VGAVVAGGVGVTFDEVARTGGGRVIGLGFACCPKFRVLGNSIADCERMRGGAFGGVWRDVLCSSTG